MSNAHVSQPADSEVIERTVLRPREQATVLLGVYEDLIPQPNFMVESKAAKAATVHLKANLVRVNSHGDYRLSYFLENNSDSPVEVTIRESYAAGV
ncbi:MAG TPA: hypothetical protein VD907_04410 [Verrucomicrobiae bacterium]|nr:hypothetical protein [Verrucomicrobiae bacterium]